MIDPASGEHLFLSSDGDRICSPSGNSWPIRDGIPRFVSDEHLASFGLQWNRYEVAHNEEDRATFEAKTGVKLSNLTGLNVLDAGCGGGRYSRIVAEAGANVVGVDHTSAVEKAQALCHGTGIASGTHDNAASVEFIQADLKSLPFPQQSFDFVFSIGVMHHDADTKKVFDRVAKLVKPGGRFSVWLYRKNQFWQEWINRTLRGRTTRMPPEKLERWCLWGAWLGGIPIARWTLNKIINFSAHPNRENRICDTFDWYAPKYQHHHTEQELLSWFREAGFQDLRVLPPEKSGRFYNWAYRQNLLIGSGVNVTGIRS